jgi:hypothetical protein
MSEVYESSFQNEQSSLIYSQQRTGVNEVTLGMPQVGTPGTATSDLTRVQEGSRKFDYCYANLKDGLINPVIMDIACNQQQFGPTQVNFFDYAENGDLAQQFFSFPNDLLREQVLIRIKSAGQQGNDLLNRQNFQQIAQMFQMYGTEILQLPIIQQNPQLSMVVQSKIAYGATELFKQILDTFNVRNIERILPLKELEVLIQNATNPQSAGTGTAQIPATAGSSPSSPPFLTPSTGASAPPSI